MKGSTAAFLALGVFNAGILILRHAADRHAKKVAEADAIDCRSDEVKEAVSAAMKRCDIWKNLTAREKKNFEDDVKNWKIAHDFDVRKNDILSEIEAGMDEYKGQIGYNEKISEIKDNFEASVEAFKNSIDYDTIKDRLESSIKDAKAQFENKKSAFELASDDISDVTMKLRHAEEEAMTNKVKEAKEKLEALEKQLTAETEKLTQKQKADIRVIEEKVSKESIRIRKKVDKDLEKLNEELTKAQEDIQKKIRKSRTDDEKFVVMNHEEDVKTLRLQKEADADLARDIFESRPIYMRFAEYLKSRKIPKVIVGIVASLPLIPVGYLVIKYVEFVVLVLKGMSV